MESKATTMVDHKIENLSASEQKEQLWDRLKSFNAPAEQTNSACPRSTSTSTSREWPSYDKVIEDMTKADYHHTLSCPLDMVNQDSSASGKSICPHGAVCQARLELFDLPEGQTPYTGLLSPGTTAEHCLLRFSSAMKPPGEAIQSTWARSLLYTTGHKLRNAQLFPCAAIKVFRNNNDNGAPSGNLLFGGSKIGQRERDYFRHCQCTSMTERMPRLVKPFVGKFWKYSNYPLSLGISEFCTLDAQGQGVEEVNFPFALILKPHLRDDSLDSANDSDNDGADSAFDQFLDKVLHVPAGTCVFDLFACPQPSDVPDPSKLQRIGKITTTSEMISSMPNDGLFFKHQKKEEDYDMRPEWRQALLANFSIDEGKTKGTIGQLAGWKLFEQHIAMEAYQDFEKDEALL